MDRTNEYEDPGGNYPDRGGAAASEDVIPPQDDPSHVASGIGVVGGEPGTSENVQDEPVMDVDEVSDLDKIAGIVVQTRADLGTEDESRIAEVLSQRLHDAGIELSEVDIAELAGQVARGESGRGE